MKWIKCIWYFLVAFIGMCMIGLFGLIGICAVKGIFDYLFTYCNDLMWYTMYFAIGLIGAVGGWCLFCDGSDKLRKK